jgi:FHA domain
MALLKNLHTGRTVALGARVLVGRAGTCALCLDSRMVSNEHASVWWESGVWMVRDVGSRNGTQVDGRKLAPGERAELQPGAVLVFGHEEHTWTLVDAGAPVAIARADDGQVVAAVGGVLSLPNADEPLYMVFEGRDGQWAMEGPDGVRAVRDGSPVAAAGRGWILHLPVGHTSTWTPAVAALSISTVGLRFRLSRDEEYIELFLLHGGAETHLQARAHFELLLVLARARLEDADHPPSERGWRYADELQRGLGLEGAAFNLYIFRARQQFGEAEVAGAAGVVERRASTGQVRLGVERIEVESLG